MAAALPATAVDQEPEPGPEPGPEIDEVAAAFNHSRLWRPGGPAGVEGGGDGGAAPAAEQTGDKGQPARRGCGRRRYADDVRHYAVWHVPGDRDAVGVWSGPFPDVWKALQARLPDKNYVRNDGVALRRASTFDDAIALWKKEARLPKHGIDNLDTAFHFHCYPVD